MILILLGAMLLLAAFIGGFMTGRQHTTGAPTPAEANVAMVDTARAEDDARDAAQAKAHEVMQASDLDVAKRVEQLRARGRAGE